MSEVDWIIFDDAGEAIGKGRGYLVEPEHDPIRALQDGLEFFGRVTVREPISITRTIELLPMDHFVAGGPSRQSKGKGRKARKAFQRKLGGGW